MDSNGSKVVEFARVFLFPWVKGRIALEDRMVKTLRVNTILNIIPAGTDTQTMPLSNITSVGVNTQYNIKSILIGIVAVWLGFMMLKSSFLATLVLLLIGAAYIGGGIITVINFARGGGNYILKAACYNKKALLEIADAINGALVDTELGKDSREGAKVGAALNEESYARQTDRLIEAMNASKK